MKQFRDLVITGTSRQLDAVLAEMTSLTSESWRHDVEAEREIVLRSNWGDSYHCFLCTAAPDRKAARVWFLKPTEGPLAVVNVLPRDAARLTHDEYNAVLLDFYVTVASPAADKAGATAALGPTDWNMEDHVSPKAFQLLSSFSRLSNRESLHALDRERWYQFIIAAHKERSPLTAGDLERWLTEDQGWSADRAYELVTDYEQERELLQVYDRRELASV